MTDHSGRDGPTLQSPRPAYSAARAMRQWRAAAWLALAGVAALSLMPVAVPPALDELNADKLVHVGMYATLMLCFSYGYARRHWAMIASGLSFYGVLIEFLQGQTGYRSPSWLDALANLTGVSIMLWLRARQDNRRRVARAARGFE